MPLEINRESTLESCIGNETVIEVELPKKKVKTVTKRKTRIENIERFDPNFMNNISLKIDEYTRYLNGEDHEETIQSSYRVSQRPVFR